MKQIYISILKTAKRLALGCLILSLSGGLGFADKLTITINTKAGSEGLIHLAIFDETNTDKFPSAELIFSAGLLKISWGKSSIKAPTCLQGALHYRRFRILMAILNLTPTYWAYRSNPMAFQTTPVGHLDPQNFLMR